MPPKPNVILVKFDGSCTLPMAETCFMALTVPTKHVEFSEFKRFFSTALKYGAKGFSFN